MTSTKQSTDVEARLQNVLADVARSAAGLKVLVVGDPSGLAVAALARESRTQTATAMATLLLSAVGRVTTNLQLVGPFVVTIESPRGCVVVHDLGDGFSLLGLVDGEADLEPAKVAMSLRVSVLRQILEDIR